MAEVETSNAYACTDHNRIKLNLWLNSTKAHLQNDMKES